MHGYKAVFLYFPAIAVEKIKYSRYTLISSQESELEF